MLLEHATRFAARHRSPGGARGRLLILTYHRVPARPDALLVDELDAAAFERQVRIIARAFEPLTVSSAARALAAGNLPARAVCITFDDGYTNNLEVALPILERHGVPATVFVASAFVELGIMWNDLVIEALRATKRDVLELDDYGLGRIALGDVDARRKVLWRILERLKYLPQAERQVAAAKFVERAGVGVPVAQMMNAAQLRELADSKLIEIGAHTRLHPILTRVAAEEARAEISGSRADLESLLQRPVTSFAYPNGRAGRDYGAEHVTMVRESGFTSAVTTDWGCADARSNPFELPRISSWDRTPARMAVRLLRAYGDVRAASHSSNIAITHTMVP